MRATIKMGEIEYEGELTVDCFYTDRQWWKFEMTDRHFDKEFLIARYNFKSRYEALTDAKNHGVTVQLPTQT